MILVVAEHHGGTLNRATLETVTAAEQLAAGEPIAIAALGAPPNVLDELARCGASTVLALEHDALDVYTPDAWTMALDHLIRSISPRIVLLAHTYQTRDFAPRLAARMRKPLIADVTATRGAGALATFTRVMFRGKLAAEVKPLGDSPWFVSVQIGAFKADAERRTCAIPVTRVVATLDASSIRQRPALPFQEAKVAVDLSQAERIVAVGRGIKSQENLPLAVQLARSLGAELAASRPICDSGWLPIDRQIGSSGQTVAPSLYVALGISGAIQHQVGMKGARIIVAINSDADAPIFEIADYGMVGHLFEIAPAIIAAIES